MTYAPNFGGSLGRVTLDGDARKYLRMVLDRYQGYADQQRRRLAQPVRVAAP